MSNPNEINALSGSFHTDASVFTDTFSKDGRNIALAQPSKTGAQFELRGPPLVMRLYRKDSLANQAPGLSAGTNISTQAKSCPDGLISTSP
jgi:hypothetical protein